MRALPALPGRAVIRGAGAGRLRGDPQARRPSLTARPADLDQPILAERNRKPTFI
jgi:hypothetical protein